MRNKIKIGQIGEEIAYKYLFSRGYFILNRNFWKKFGEIDIIAIKQDKTLVFVEVKTLQIKKMANLQPEDNFTTHKLKKVKRICQFFAAEHPELIQECSGWCIDLIAIEIMPDGKFLLRHHENV